MKTVSLTAALSAMTLLTACGTIEILDGMRVRCNNERVSVINVPAGLKVRPAEVEVCRGYSVALVFRNAVPPGDARLRTPAAAGEEERREADAREGRVTGPPWLNVDNASPDRIVVEVPEDATPMSYKYSLEIVELGLLDPRIVVQ